jgi:hypothetical protein
VVAALAAVLLVAAASATAWALGGLGDSDDLLFEAEFDGSDRLLTNEFAFRYPDSPDAVVSSQWFVTSGSLFVRADAATNGTLDDREANPDSTTGTNSAVFRAYTKHRFRPSYRVTFEVRVEPPRQVPGLRPAPWDGLHLMVDANSPEAAYYVSLYRRNGQAVIKKKTPGGTVAGGSYAPLSRYVPCHIEPGRWTEVRIDVRSAGSRAVTIDLYENGTLLTTATDQASLSGTPPFAEGRLGIRADKTNFEIREFRVEAL